VRMISSRELAAGHGGLWDQPFNWKTSLFRVRLVQNGPEPSRARRWLGAAKRTLDGENRFWHHQKSGKGSCAGVPRAAP
jgi:hypothetical protein